MLLRASGQMTGSEVDVHVVDGTGQGDGGVAHGALLVRFTEAAMRSDDGGLASLRSELLCTVGPEAFVEVAALIGSFNVVDRVADATGIPLDATLEAASRDIRETLGLSRFASSANTRSQ